MKKCSVIGLCIALMMASVTGCSGKTIEESVGAKTQTSIIETKIIEETMLEETILEETVFEEKKFEETMPAIEETSNVHTIENCFPEHWAGRYIIVQEENGVSVYCKLAAEQDDMNRAWLFSVYHMTGDLVLPDYSDLGIYEGAPVHATLPWSIPTFESAEAAAEYEEMIYEVSDVFDAIKNKIAENNTIGLEEEYPIDMNNYNVPEAFGVHDPFVGVFRLIQAEWSEESKNELLHPYNQNGFISIAPDGTLYVRRGSETVTGKAYLHKNYASISDEPIFVLVFDDGAVHPAYLDQLILTVHGMESYTDTNGNASTSWSFIFDDFNWWTEESMRSDIG